MDKVRGSPPLDVKPAPSDGELIPPPHLFNPPVGAINSDSPPLDPDILNIGALSNELSSRHSPPHWRASNVILDGSTKSPGYSSSSTVAIHFHVQRLIRFSIVSLGK